MEQDVEVISKEEHASLNTITNSFNCDLRISKNDTAENKTEMFAQPANYTSCHLPLSNCYRKPETNAKRTKNLSAKRSLCRTEPIVYKPSASSMVPRPTCKDINEAPIVEFALRLGYRRKHISDVLLSLRSSNTVATPDILLEQLLTEPETLLTSVPKLPVQEKKRLRPIVIDGSNIAMCHGNREYFSTKGLRICVDWFVERGHTDVIVFLPSSRRESTRPDCIIKDQHILSHLEQERHLVYTPSKRINGRRVICYDDRYILKLAAENNGIVVSNDHYRDLADEFRSVIDNRVLMFSFVKDRFMPPDDPLGRNGPNLDDFLCFPSKNITNQSVATINQPCPYKERCTYGSKCKYIHKEKPDNVSIIEKIAKQEEINRAESPSLTSHNDLYSGQRPRAHTADEIAESTIRTKSLPCQSSHQHNDLRRTSSNPNKVADGPQPKVNDWYLEADHSHKLLTHKRTLNYAPVPHLPLQMSFSDSCVNFATIPNIYPHQMMIPPPQNNASNNAFYQNSHLGSHRMVYQTTSAPQENQEQRMGATRDKLFCNLCLIFPADKVTEVMLASPLETSSQILCARLKQLCKP